MSHLKFLIGATFIINFIIVVSYQLFYGAPSPVKYQVNLEYDRRMKDSLGKNQVLNKQRHNEKKIDEVSKDIEISKEIEQTEEPVQQEMAENFTEQDLFESKYEQEQEVSNEEQIIDNNEQNETMIDESAELIQKQVEDTLYQLTPFEYKPVPEELYNDDSDTHDSTFFEKQHMGLIHGQNQCQLSDLHFIFDPENSSNQLVILTDLEESDIGFDLQNIERIQDLQVIPINSTIIWTKDSKFHYYHEMGTHFLCTFQKYNHIPGHGVIKQPLLFYQSVMDNPENKRIKKLLKEFYLLHNIDSCIDFFKGVKENLDYSAISLDGKEYQLQKEELDILKDRYQNGDLCGEIKDLVLVVKNNPPSIQVKQIPVEINVDLFISSTQPLRAYVADPIVGDDIDLKNLSKLLIQQEVTKKDLSKSLDKAIKEFVEDLIAITESSLYKDARVFEVYQLKFTLDQKLRLYYEGAEIIWNLPKGKVEEVLSLEEEYRKNLLSRIKKNLFNYEIQSDLLYNESEMPLKYFKNKIK